MKERMTTLRIKEMVMRTKMREGMCECWNRLLDFLLMLSEVLSVLQFSLLTWQYKLSCLNLRIQWFLDAKIF